jgi:hypothetical protein
MVAITLEAHRHKAARVDRKGRATRDPAPVARAPVAADLMVLVGQGAPAADRDPDDGEAAAAVGRADRPPSRESSIMQCRSMPTATESLIAPN